MVVAIFARASSFVANIPHAERSELQNIDTVSGLVVLGFLVIILSFLYLLDNEDEEIKLYSWKVAAATLSTIIAVLNVSSFNTCANLFLDPVLIKCGLSKITAKLSTDGFQFFVWFLLMHWTTSYCCHHTGGAHKRLRINGLNKLLSNIGSFAAINFGLTLMSFPVFDNHPAMSILTVGVVFVLFFCIYRLTDYLRSEIVYHGIVYDTLNEQVEHAENSLAYITLSFLLVQCALYCSAGILPLKDPPHTLDQARNVYTFRCIALMFLTCIVCQVISVVYVTIKFSAVKMDDLQDNLSPGNTARSAEKGDSPGHTQSTISIQRSVTLKRFGIQVPNFPSPVLSSGNPGELVDDSSSESSVDSDIMQERISKKWTPFSNLTCFLAQESLAHHSFSGFDPWSLYLERWYISVPHIFVLSSIWALYCAFEYSLLWVPMGERFEFNPDSTIRKLLLALLMSLYLFSSIFALDWVADNITGRSSGITLVIRFMCDSYGVLIGFAWGNAFDYIAKDVSEVSLLRGSGPYASAFAVMVQVSVTTIVTLIIFPLWWTRIQITATQLEEEEEIDRWKTKKSSAVQRVMILPTNHEPPV